MGHPIAGATVAPWIAWLPLLAAAAPPQLAVVDRQVVQSGADWTVAYRIRYVGASPLQFTADEISVEYSAVVSNTRCPAHGFPQAVDLTLSGAEGLWGSAELIDAAAPMGPCRERVSVSLGSPRERSSDSIDPPAVLQITALKPQDSPSAADASRVSSPPTELRPGDTLSATIALTHEHNVCRDRDPLLGPRRFRIRLGPAVVEDEVTLDRVYELAHLPRAELAPEESRCDAGCFHSPPNSLHLHAGRPRNLAYRFPSFPVHHGSTVWVSFWYRVHPESEGTCRVRVGQYQDDESGWTRLGDAFDRALPVRGKWTRFERQLTVGRDATTLCLDFRLADGDGEAWIDDVVVQPVAPLGAGR